mmetsp:Transcript_5255/g.8066  ORF Transcript_5255/g.8066 Transcript_5255/m.8066 type:complete len:214 (+) Transcript_5255:2698-3339(+)
MSTSRTSTAPSHATLPNPDLSTLNPLTVASSASLIDSRSAIDGYTSYPLFVSFGTRCFAAFTGETGLGDPPDESGDPTTSLYKSSPGDLLPFIEGVPTVGDSAAFKFVICCVGNPGDSLRPFSTAATGVLPLVTPFVNINRVFGFGVRELGLMNKVFVAEPTNLLGERIGDPFFRPKEAIGDCLVVEVYPRGRILAADLGVGRRERRADDDVA